MSAWTIDPGGSNATDRRRHLQLRGPILDLIVRREEGAAPEEGVPDYLECRAIIDTGASDVCIDYRIAHALKLRLVDGRTIGTVGGPIYSGVHMAVVDIPLLGWCKLARVYAPKLERPGYSMLLGRSFLVDFVMTYDGLDGLCHFASKVAGLDPAEDE